MDETYGLALDFDEVMVETIQSVVSIINEDYNLSVDYRDVRKWDFSDVFPDISTKEIYKTFEDPRFFSRLKFKDNIMEVLNKLNNKVPIIIVSMGTRKNLLMKKKFIKQNLFLNKMNIKFIGLIEDIQKKDEVDLHNFVFVDDNQENLEVCNANKKILFENFENAEWNKDWTGEKIKNIIEILKYF